MFDEAMLLVLKHEGGYVNHPDDHGGPTNWGITINTLSRYRGRQCNEIDVKNLSLDEAKEIYHDFYWKPLRLDEILNKKLQLAIFDLAVLCGTREVIEKMQQVLGIAVDGILGSHTLIGINGYFDERLLLLKFIAQIQLRFVSICTQNPSQIVFLQGWISRTQALMFI